MPRRIRDVDFTEERAGTIASAIQVGVAANTLATTANNTVSAINSWCVVNSNFNAITNRSYFVNTSTSNVTAVLPSLNLSVGDRVTLNDYAGTWSSNSVYIVASSILNDSCSSVRQVCTRNGGITLTYSGVSWIVTSAANNASFTSFCYDGCQSLYTVPGTYTFIAPSFATSVSAVAIGGGASAVPLGWNYGDGGGGGGLGWKNNIPVTPGCSYTVVVGQGGYQSAGGNSFFANSSTVWGGGGGYGDGTRYRNPGGYVGDGGGCGGRGGDTIGSFDTGGGGGAGGYCGNGGAGAVRGGSACAGCGGGAGGGVGHRFVGGGAGGGVNVFGQGANGAAGGGAGAGGGGGSCGDSGGGGGGDGSGGSGGLYGGGAGGYTNDGDSPTIGYGANGAVRIIWGSGRSYPLNVANV